MANFPAGKQQSAVVPVLWLGAVLAAISGLALLAGYPAKALTNWIFAAKFAEVRVASGALANLYVFMATCRPGDTIIAPPAVSRPACAIGASRCPASTRGSSCASTTPRR